MSTRKTLLRMASFFAQTASSMTSREMQRKECAIFRLLGCALVNPKIIDKYQYFDDVIACRLSCLRANLLGCNAVSFLERRREAGNVVVAGQMGCL